MAITNVELGGKAAACSKFASKCVRVSSSQVRATGAILAGDHRV